MLSALPWVSGAGAVGAVARWGLTRATSSWDICGLPLGVAVVNVLGCLLAGAFFGWSIPRTELSPEVKLAVLVGFLGSFTTFSAMAGEAVTLISDGRPAAAAIHLVLQNVLGVLAFLAGWWVSHRF